MRSLGEIPVALEGCYSSMEALCADLGDAEWQVQSLCPDWKVRDVVNHVTSMEAVMAGWLPEDTGTPPPFERAGDYLRETAGLDSAAFERPSWMPTGPGTYGRFLGIRVFDFWVHERDITTPLARVTDDTGVDAEIALAEVESSLGYIVGKKVGLPDGKSIAFHLTGPIVRELDVLVDGRAKQVDRLENPDVEVTTDSTTFIQLACGRIDPQVRIDSGAINWKGDAELGERAARNLRFTM